MAIVVAAAVTGVLGLLLGSLPEVVLRGGVYGLDYEAGAMAFLIGLVVVLAAEWVIAGGPTVVRELEPRLAHFAS